MRKRTPTKTAAISRKTSEKAHHRRLLADHAGELAESGGVGVGAERRGHAVRHPPRRSVTVSRFQ
jgi:hypothetical protein